MVVIKEVLSKKEQREFLNFPLKLYKNNNFFVPPLMGDERKIFNKNYHYYKTCEAIYFLAYQNNKVVGRISAIIQKTSNEIRNEKRVRFTRFDSIDDFEVSDALFNACESWAKSKGMTEIVGPLGFSDLEREGLLIKGFDQDQTFEEQYNFDYYQKLIEHYGFEKEVDWTESKLYLPDEYDEKYQKLAELVRKRYGLHYGKAKNIKEFIKLYLDDFFDLVDKSYSKIYGCVPLNDEMRKSLAKSFKLIVKVENVVIILNEKDEPVAFGICFPAIGKVVSKYKGKLNLFSIIELLKTINHPKVLDLGLIGVDPDYLNRGISAIICADLLEFLKRENVDHCETNLNLENNFAIKNQWKRFKEVENKRRRCFVKTIG